MLSPLFLELEDEAILSCKACSFCDSVIGQHVHDVADRPTSTNRGVHVPADDNDSAAHLDEQLWIPFKRQGSQTLLESEPIHRMK